MISLEHLTVPCFFSKHSIQAFLAATHDPERPMPDLSDGSDDDDDYDVSNFCTILSTMYLDVVLSAAAEFRARIHGPCHDFPLDFMIFCKRSLTRPCIARKEKAKTYLASSNPHVKKVVEIFRAGLTRCVDTGMPDTFLFAASLAVAKKWRCDTDEVEGYNNILKHQVRRAPYISRELLPSRSNLVKALGIGGREAATYKWDDVSSIVEYLRDEVLSNISDWTQVLTREKLGRRRWEPITTVTVEQDLKKLCPLPPPAKAALLQNTVKGIRSSLAWKAKWQTFPLAPLGKCISLGGIESAWLCPKVLGGALRAIVAHSIAVK